jgi:hypothetical protein
MDLIDNPAALTLVEAEVERAIEPYREVLDGDALEEMRQTLRYTLLLHPTVSRYVARLVPAPDVAVSGTQETDDNPNVARGTQKIG